MFIQYFHLQSRLHYLAWCCLVFAIFIIIVGCRCTKKVLVCASNIILRKMNLFCRFKTVTHTNCRILLEIRRNGFENPCHDLPYYSSISSKSQELETLLLTIFTNNNQNTRLSQQHNQKFSEISYLACNKCEMVSKFP